MRRKWVRGVCEPRGERETALAKLQVRGEPGVRSQCGGQARRAIPASEVAGDIAEYGVTTSST